MKAAMGNIFRGEKMKEMKFRFADENDTKTILEFIKDPAAYENRLDEASLAPSRWTGGHPIG